MSDGYWTVRVALFEVIPEKVAVIWVVPTPKAVARPSVPV